MMNAERIFLNDKRCQNLNEKRWTLSKKINAERLNGINFLNGNKPEFWGHLVE